MQETNDMQYKEAIDTLYKKTRNSLVITTIELFVFFAMYLLIVISASFSDTESKMKVIVILVSSIFFVCSVACAVRDIVYTKYDFDKLKNGECQVIKGIIVKVNRRHMQTTTFWYDIKNCDTGEISDFYIVNHYHQGTELKTTETPYTFYYTEKDKATCCPELDKELAKNNNK